jgi:hypothetical protein
MKLKEEETLKAFGCMYCAFRCDKIGRLHNTEVKLLKIALGESEVADSRSGTAFAKTGSE